MQSSLPVLIGSTTPQSVVMFSGAGVSVDGPASLPNAQELTRRVFGAFFEDNALDIVLGHHADMDWQQLTPCPVRREPTRPRMPRLETVLGVAARVYGDEAVPRVLADAMDAPPGGLHEFFAAHLAHGGRHVTANFDDCIERAADAQYPGWRAIGSIHHFHGCIADDPSGRSLGATLRRIEGGFDDSQATALRRMLPEEGLLLVVGYSGGDFFDVDAAIAALPAGALERTRVLWACHSEHDWHPVDLSEVAVPPLTCLLRRAGAQVDVFCGPTKDLITELARQWGFADVGPVTARTLRNPAYGSDPALRQKATFQLFRELGLVGEVAAVLRSGDLTALDPTQIWEARSEVLWEQGRWTVLRRLWRLPDVRAAIPAAICDERIGACLWVQGRLLPAYAWLAWHRRRCADPGQALMLAETEGRVVEHMARVPELRQLARRLAPGIISLLGTTPQTAGVHLYRRRNDLISSLASITGVAREPTQAQISSRWFAEAGSLLAALNYRHRQYRDHYRAEEISDAELSRRYRQIQLHFTGIGSPSGRWRTHLLPGAERVFGLTEIIRGLTTLQYGWWHRFRLLARYCLLRSQLPRWLRAGLKPTAAPNLGGSPSE